MRLFIQGCSITLLSIVSFLGSRYVAHNQALADRKSLEKEQLIDQHEKALADLKAKQAEELAEWTDKVGTESARHEAVKARREKHKVIYNEAGEFTVPLKALALTRVSMYSCEKTPEGLIYVPSSFVVPLLHLTEAEVAGFKEMSTRTRDEIFEAEMMRIQRREDGDVLTFAVDAYREEGQKVREQFLDRLKKFLGEDRAEAFLVLDPHDKYLSRFFMRFGKQPYSIRIYEEGADSVRWNPVKAFYTRGPKYLKLLRARRPELFKDQAEEKE